MEVLNPIFSIVVPTRNSTGPLRCLLDSLAENTVDPNSLELVLVVDEDDAASVEFEYQKIPLKKTIVDPGLTMGALNMAGYRQATGRYIMLLNDDVIVRTYGWDQKVLAAFKSFNDRIVLVHINDKIFEDKLCTFPFVSREFCEITGGICPQEYVRYRIDDHIYNIFNLLCVMGQNRILYLPDVVFEHLNRSKKKLDGIRYRPNEHIHHADTQTFESLLERRKMQALDLMEHMDASLRHQVRETRSACLADIKDSVSLRRPEYVRQLQDGAVITGKDVRVTIGVVSANIRSPHAAKCIDAIKQYTQNYDLVVLDNDNRQDFNHPVEMNRLISQCRTPYLVLMDDDVFVEKGWLDGLLSCMSPSAGLVTPMHKNAEGKLSYAGIVMKPDFSGHHSHIFKRIGKPTSVQTICSAIMLIDIGKCGHIKIDESYSKYFFDIDYGFRVWEAGYKVVCSPFSLVTHIGGGTLAQGSAKSNQLFEEQRFRFVKKWIKTQRYLDLLNTIWQRDNDIKTLLDIPAQIESLMDLYPQETMKAYLARVDCCVSCFRSVPILVIAAKQRLAYEITNKHFKGKAEHLKMLQKAFEKLSDSLAVSSGAIPLAAEGEDQSYRDTVPQLVEEGYRGFNIIRYGGFYGILQCEGAFDINRVNAGGYCVVVSGSSPAQVRFGIDRAIREFFWLNWPKLARMITRLFGWSSSISLRDDPFSREVQTSATVRGSTDAERVALVENYRGHAIFKYEHKFYVVDHQKFQDFSNGMDRSTFKSGRDFSVINHTLTGAKAEIDHKIGADSNTAAQRLVLACIPQKALKPVLESNYDAQDLTIITGSQESRLWKGYRVIDCGEPSLHAWIRKQVNGDPRDDDFLKPGMFETVIVPWVFPDTWRDNSLELVAQKYARRVEILRPDGRRRSYYGENLNRLIYNKAYLASMFQVFPRLSGKKMLEIGCSDGLTCDLLALCGAGQVTGVDMMNSAGCSFPGETIQYETMDAAQLSFADQSFDMVCSIATFEHLPDPYKVLMEILRVTAKGGHVYIQAGPLYHSPFGHHMFAYFPHEPWIHLRKSREEIIAYAHQHGIAQRIQSDLNVGCEEYVRSMLNKNHVNGLFLNHYRLDEFMRRKDIQVLKYNISYEGRELLAPQITREIKDIHSERLVEHGFELAFRRIKS